MRGFSLTVGRLAPHVVCVTLSGELDLSRALLLEQEMRSVEESGARVVVIDLDDLDFIDSSGLARLVAARRRADRGGWRLFMTRGGCAVRKLFSMAALDQAFDFVDAPGDALTVPAG